MNHAEVFILLFACARIGAMLVPLNWRLAEAEIATIVENCSPKVLIHDRHFEEPANRAIRTESRRPRATPSDHLPTRQKGTSTIRS